MRFRPPLSARITFLVHMMLSTPSHLTSITNAITAHNRSSFFGGLAWKRKNVELAGGSLSDTTFWDGLGGLSAARRISFGYCKTDAWLKCVVVAGGEPPRFPCLEACPLF